MNSYQGRMLIAVVMVVMAILTIIGLEAIINNSIIDNRLFGKNSWEDNYGVTVQNLMWVFFFLGFGELIFRIVETNKVTAGLNKSYLPEDEHTLLGLMDLAPISKKLNADKHIDGGLANFLKKLVMQFQSSNSIEQTLNMLNAQLEMRSAEIDLKYNMIRYITWLIPTLGFIGTVIGIGAALQETARMNGQGDNFIAAVTDKLAVAFDTTLVALVMSAILVFIMYIVQGREEKSLTQIGQYSLDNLINKLYVEKER